MSDPNALRAALEELRAQPDQLIEIILQQAAMIQEQAATIQKMEKRIEELENKVNDLNDRNSGLSGKVDELERMAARQAAPFRIADKHRTVNPKKPGRSKGHPGAHRVIPDHVDEEIIVALESCPACGQALQISVR